MEQDQTQMPHLRLMGKTLADAVRFIEALSGEQMTPDKIEEVRQPFDYCHPEVG